MTDLESGGYPGPSSTRVGGRWGDAVLYIVAAAMLLRFYDLPLKPLHHDEGVNTLFLSGLVQPPHVYRYDPANYHGPTLYYFGWAAASALGLSTVAIRSVTASAGMLAILAFLLMRRDLGAVGALSAGALFAVSPGAVYIARYFIHEMLLVAFTVLAIALMQIWLRRRHALYLAGAAAAAGLAFATKETAIITAGVITIAAAASAVLVRQRIDWSATRPKPLVDSFVSATGTAIRAGLAALARRRTGIAVLAFVAIFAAVTVLFYSSFFSHWKGVLDAIRSFAIWTGTGTSAHVQPWYTYLAWLSAEEMPLLLLGAAGAAHALWVRTGRFLVFAALWAAGTLTAYSLIPYKTPWLTLNILAPLAICAGHACELAWQKRAVSRRALAAVAIGLATLSIYQAVVLSFREYDNDRYPYVYSHTSREVLRLVGEIDTLQAANGRAAIAVTSPDHFPLSWYLRNYPAGYYGRPVVTGDPLVIASEDQQQVLDIMLGDRYARTGSYRLRPGVRLVLYVRTDLRRSQATS